MHEPDKEPDDSIITDMQFTVQWMANIALFGGLVFCMAGIFLTSITKKGVFLIIPTVAIISSVFIGKLAKQGHYERARSTASLAIIVNIIFFIIIFLIYLFVKEATQKF
jgi:Na+-driven multidrug efflux pump